MKRVGHLFNDVVDYANLTEAFKLAMKGCGRTPEVCRFFFHLEPELLRLQDELRSGAYQPGSYRCFMVYDPKERVIAVAPFCDRVVHHAVVRVLTPLYERVFIYDSYATRKGKGTHAAVLRAQRFLRRRPWYLKLDVNQYFSSVDRGILLGLVERKVKDRRLLELLGRIVNNPPEETTGLPIGNLTSQFFANVYLDPLDHKIKDHLGVHEYVRYMDDMILFAHDKQTLMAWKGEVTAFLLERLALRLKPAATCLQRTTHGLSFLGMRIFPRFIRMKPENRFRSCQRMRKRIKEWEQGRIDEEKMVQSLTSTIGHMRYFSPHAKIPLGDRFQLPAGPTG